MMKVAALQKAKIMHRRAQTYYPDVISIVSIRESQNEVKQTISKMAKTSHLASIINVHVCIDDTLHEIQLLRFCGHDEGCFIVLGEETPKH